MSRISEDTDAKKAIVFVALMLAVGTIFAMSGPGNHHDEQGTINPRAGAAQR